MLWYEPRRRLRQRQPDQLHSNGYINFLFTNETFISVWPTGNGFAFDSDNRSLCAANIPEPGSLALLGMGLVGLYLSTRCIVV